MSSWGFAGEFQAPRGLGVTHLLFGKAHGPESVTAAEASAMTNSSGRKRQNVSSGLCVVAAVDTAVFHIHLSNKPTNHSCPSINAMNHIHHMKLIFCQADRSEGLVAPEEVPE